MSFVYRIKFIGHWKNVLCDEMGSWKQTGQHKNTINVQDIKQEISSKLKDDSISCDNLKSIRHKFVNGTSPDLHRVVIHLEQADGTVFDKVFVQYYHDKELHFFNLFLMETVKNVKVIRELLKQRRPTLKVW